MNWSIWNLSCGLELNEHYTRWSYYSVCVAYWYKQLLQHEIEYLGTYIVIPHLFLVTISKLSSFKKFNSVRSNTVVTWKLTLSNLLYFSWFLSLSAITLLFVSCVLLEKSHCNKVQSDERVLDFRSHLLIILKSIKYFK